ncbi:hypothetical protein XA68_16390 [Ophiocordyceps unilateralis]|uniref:Uncharacterized protein n=1 Tax=Ophiocordyceps unilateralis TaxID=268505 RepID=A0A2A9P6P1_OPHUN|nr:hypothetical protein XA68_16390 [Ophiocordyceps unilateralis]
MHIAAAMALLAGLSLATPAPKPEFDVLGLIKQTEQAPGRPLMTKERLEASCASGWGLRQSFPDKETCMADLACFASLHKMQTDQLKDPRKAAEVVVDKDELAACTKAALQKKVFG